MTIRPLVLTGALVAAIFVPVAPSAHAEPAAPVPAKVDLRQTRHADVDGDGRLDTVRIYDTGKKGDNTVWKVTVVTAAGTTGSAKLLIASYQTTRPWYGSARLDGHRGAELLFETHTDDGLGLEVLTWSGAKLHRESAPSSPIDPAKKWGSWFAAQEASSTSGYRFFSAGGHRYVNAWASECPNGADSKACTLKVLRSVWRNGAWHKVSTLPATKVAPKTVFTRNPLGAVAIHR